MVSDICSFSPLTMKRDNRYYTLLQPLDWPDIPINPSGKQKQTKNQKTMKKSGIHDAHY